MRIAEIDEDFVDPITVRPNLEIVERSKIVSAEEQEVRVRRLLQGRQSAEDC